MKIYGTTIVAITLAVFAIVGCEGDSGPTVATPAPAPLSAAPSFSSASGTSGDSSQEPFSCADVENARVRFSNPGFVLGPNVGLFVEYEEAPPGDKIVHITWDEKNNPGFVERLNVGRGIADQDGNSDLAGLVHWVYPDVIQAEEMQVRVNLMVEGRNGNCSRVRRITVTPGPSLGLPPRPPGHNTPKSGLELETIITPPAGGTFTASAVVVNTTSEIVVDAKVAFVTPPGFGVSSICFRGSESRGVIFCDVGAIGPNGRSPSVSVKHSARMSESDGSPVPGAVAVVHSGMLGQVVQYVVEAGGGGVTNLREIAR